MSDDIETGDADVPALPPPDVEADADDVGSRAAGDASEDPIYRRVVGDNTRKLFQAAAKSLAEQIADGGDDEEVAIKPPDDKPVAAVGAAPSPGAALAQPAAAAPALDAVTNRRALELDVREQSITAREAEIAAREKSGTTLESMRDKYADNPSATFRDLIKTLTGVEDADLKDEVMDLVVLLSEDVLGVPASKEVKLAVDAKRAVRTVKQYKADQAKREAEAAKKATATEAAARQTQLERQAIDGIAAHLPSLGDKFPHLMAEDAPHEIVWSVITEQRKRSPDPDNFVPDLAGAIALANNHFQAQHEKQRQKLSRLPTPATKPALGVSTQGAAQSRAARSLTNATTAPLAPAAPVDSDEPYDKHKARRASMSRVAAAIKERST